MEEGQIALAVIPSDREQKRRPVLIIRKAPRYGDYLVCGITSKLHEEVEGLDLLINSAHPDFSDSGLKHDGLIRLFFVAVLRDEECLGLLGNISKQTLDLLQTRLANYITQKA